jgi:hypothetical protein
VYSWLVTIKPTLLIDCSVYEHKGISAAGTQIHRAIQDPCVSKPPIILSFTHVLQYE